jgi:hypothetical protein
MRLLLVLFLMTLQVASAAAPKPGGGGHARGHLLRPNEPLHFQFQFDRKTPYNPVKVPVNDRRDFSVELRQTANGPALLMNNRCPSPIPVQLFGAEGLANSTIVVEGKSQISVPIRKSRDTIYFFFNVHDDGAIAP